MNTQKKNYYRKDVDGLRGLAILAVVGFHGFPEYVASGYVGVSIFFVISGYLITGILIRGISNNALNVFDFWGRRVKRLLPSLIVVLFSALVIGCLTLLPNELKELGKYIAASVLFIVNFLEMFQAGYFDLSSEYKPLLHIWSLGIEEQFYIIWPIYLLLIGRCRVSSIHAVLIPLLLSFLANITLYVNYPVHNFYLPISRFFEILAGACLAVIHINKKSDLIYNTLSIFGFLMILVSIFVFNKNTQYPGYIVLLPIFGSVFLIFAGEKNYLNKFILGNNLLVWFGLISYPLYLWHWMLLSYASIISSAEPPIHYRAFIVAISIFISWLSYEYLEKPIRKSRSKVIVPGLMFVLLIIGTAAPLIKMFDGFPERVKVYLKNYHANNSINPAEKYCIQLTKIDARYCRIDNDMLKPTVALIGDSIADGLFDALAQKYRGINDNLILMGNAGCLPMYGVETVSTQYINDCQSKNEKIYKFLINNDSIKTVIFSFWGNYYYSGHDVLQPERLTSNLFLGEISNNRENILLGSVSNTAKILASYGKRMIVISNPPEFYFDPRPCVIDFRPFSSIFVARPECSQPKEVTENRNQGYIGQIKKIAKDDKFNFIDIGEILCRERNCVSAVNGQLIYRDNYHLNTIGAEYVVDKIWDKVGH